MIKDLSIIIVNYNSKYFTMNCVKSLRNHTHGLDYEIIIIDNASYDGISDLIDDRTGNLKFIQSDTNLGFAGANNAALPHAESEYLLFLNPDTLISDNSIKKLYNTISTHPHIGVLGCIHSDGNGNINANFAQAFPTILNQNLDSTFLRRVAPKSPLWGLQNLYTNSNLVKVDAVSGACLLIRKKLFLEIGCFSQDYFMFSEDVDLCFKSVSKGYVNYLQKDCEIVHYGGQSSKGNSSSTTGIAIFRKSRHTYFKNNKSKFTAGVYRLTSFLSSLLRLFFLFPAYLVSRNTSRTKHSNSIKKWLAILHWSLNTSNQISRWIF